MVNVSLHNVVIVGLLAVLFLLIVKKAASTGLGNVPVVGDGLRLAASV